VAEISEGRARDKAYVACADDDDLHDGISSVGP
jgi:hypothetical protein